MMYIQQYNSVRNNEIYYVSVLHKDINSIIVFESYYKDEVEPNVVALSELLCCPIDGELL